MSSSNDSDECNGDVGPLSEFDGKFEDFSCCGSVDDEFVNENRGADPDADGCDENGPPN